MARDDEYTPSASSTVDLIADMAGEMDAFRDHLLDMARKLCLDDKEACDTFCAMEQMFHELLASEWKTAQSNLDHYSEKELKECDWTGYEQDMPTHFPADLTPAQLKAMIAKRNSRPVPTNPATRGW